MARLPASPSEPGWFQRFKQGLERRLRALETPQSYTVSTLPDAAANTGRVLFVSNEAGGAVIAFSDGSQWRRATDRAVVS